MSEVPVKIKTARDRCAGPSGVGGERWENTVWLYTAPTGSIDPFEAAGYRLARPVAERAAAGATIRAEGWSPAGTRYCC